MMYASSAAKPGRACRLAACLDCSCWNLCASALVGGAVLRGLSQICWWLVGGITTSRQGTRHECGPHSNKVRHTQACLSAAHQKAMEPHQPMEQFPSQALREGNALKGQGLRTQNRTQGLLATRTEQPRITLCPAPPASARFHPARWTPHPPGSCWSRRHPLARTQHTSCTPACTSPGSNPPRPPAGGLREQHTVVALVAWQGNLSCGWRGWRGAAKAHARQGSLRNKAHPRAAQQPPTM